MAQKKRQSEADRVEAAKLAQFQKEQEAKRKLRIKQIIVAIICVALVIAFCFPAASVLLGV